MKSGAKTPNIFVIGASAGGVEPIREIVRALPADLQAAVFIVIYVSPLSPSILPNILRGPDRMHVAAAEDGEPIVPSRIYVAPPDLHMLIEPGYVRLSRGPRENRHRPAIDPLFRTAARAYGPRVSGVVLTGMQDDGALGLVIISSQGGVTIVQDPAEAAFPSMPVNGLKKDDVNYVLKVAEIGPKLVELVGDELWRAEEPARAKVILREFPRPEGEKMSERFDERIQGKPSMFTCPDCNGTLWEAREGKLLRFRCRVGHAFSPESMRDGYTESIEAALWSAVRVLEESASLERRLADEASAREDHMTADRFRDVAEGRNQQANLIREMLMSKENPEERANEIT